MDTELIFSFSIIISLGFLIYKKIAEPISLYLINQSIKVSEESYSNALEKKERLLNEVKKLEVAMKDGE